MALSLTDRLAIVTTQRARIQQIHERFDKLLQPNGDRQAHIPDWQRSSLVTATKLLDELTLIADPESEKDYYWNRKLAEAMTNLTDVENDHT